MSLARRPSSPPSARVPGLLVAALLVGLGAPRAARADDVPPPVGPAAPAAPGTTDPTSPPAAPAPMPPGTTLPGGSGLAGAGDAAGAGPELRLSLAEAERLGAARNLELLAGAYDPAIAERGIDAADGAFDTLLTAGLEGGRRESLANVSFTGTDVTREDYVTATAGVERRFRNGGRLSAVFSADRLKSNSAVVDRNPAWTTGVSVEYAQPLLRGAGDVAMADVRRARAAARAADHGLDALTDVVLLRIETAYWNLAFLRAQVAARRKAEELAENLVRDTGTRFEARVATVLDVADAKSGLEARRGDRIFAEGEAAKAEDELRALILPHTLGTPAARLVPTDDPRTVPASEVLDPRDVERYLTQAVRARPDLLAARASLETQDVDVAVAQDDLRPQLDLVARLSVDGLDGGFGGALEETASGQATTGTLGLNFSLYLGRRSAHARLCMAVWARSQAAIRVREQENRVVQEVRAALTDLATSTARRTTALGELEAAREALDGEQRKEKNGESTPFRVLEKEEQVTQAVTREGRAAADVRIATARLWKALGMLRTTRGVARPTTGG